MHAVSRLLVRCLICCAAAWSGGAVAWLSGAGSAHAATPRGHRLAGRHWWRESRGRSPLSARRGGSPRAHAAVVGGSPISVERAPWQVVVLGKIPVEYQGQEEYFYQLCGGAIIGETEVLTAAHCMFNPQTGEPASASDFFVEAGSSDIKAIEPTEQNIEVESIRVHPYFSYAAGPGAPDDIAVLTLAKRLNLTGPAARAIGVAPAGPLPAEGAQAGFSGFGLQNASTEELTGKLYSLGMGVGLSEKCGGEADALFVCASAPTGSVCAVDEGGGLTSTGATPALVGILSTFEGRSNETCNDGSLASFVNLVAPEIRDFIESEALPPKAPRGGAGLKVAGVPTAGNMLTCSPGSWSGERRSPTLSSTAPKGRSCSRDPRRPTSSPPPTWGGPSSARCRPPTPAAPPSSRPPRCHRSKPLQLLRRPRLPEEVATPPEAVTPGPRNRPHRRPRKRWPLRPTKSPSPARTSACRATTRCS